MGDHARSLSAVVFFLLFFFHAPLLRALLYCEHTRSLSAVVRFLSFLSLLRGAVVSVYLILDGQTDWPSPRSGTSVLLRVGVAL